MDISSQVVPALIVLLVNLLSGPHSSLRWEWVTTVFGWGALIFIFLGLISSVVVIAPRGWDGLSAALRLLVRPKAGC